MLDSWTDREIGSAKVHLNVMTFLTATCVQCHMTGPHTDQLARHSKKSSSCSGGQSAI